MHSPKKVFHESMVRPYPTYGNLSSRESFDAIIVPQGRPEEHIIRAARLAGKIGSTLISLCSHRADVGDVANFIGKMPDGPASWYAVDVPPGYSIPDVDLVSDKEIPDFARKPETWNLSDKRNVGLAIGKMIGAERIFFLDDDIDMSADTLLSVALALQDNGNVQNYISGPKCGGYSDNSAFIHVKAALEEFHMPTQRFEYRGRGKNNFLIPGKTVTTGMLSGNSLAVNPMKVLEHFPRQIYNEDWLMMYYVLKSKHAFLAPNCECSQDAYDPFRPGRAREEEFGEIVALGLYEDMRTYRPQDTSALVKRDFSDPRSWDVMIRERKDENLEMMEAIGAERDLKYFEDHPEFAPPFPSLTMYEDHQETLKNTLREGLEVAELMNGNMIVDYLRAWREDQARWVKMTERLPKAETIKMALSRLALDTYISN